MGIPTRTSSHVNIILYPHKNLPADKKLEVTLPPFQTSKKPTQAIENIFEEAKNVPFVYLVVGKEEPKSPLSPLKEEPYVLSLARTNDQLLILVKN